MLWIRNTGCYMLSPTQNPTTIVPACFQAQHLKTTLKNSKILCQRDYAARLELAESDMGGYTLKCPFDAFAFEL